MSMVVMRRRLKAQNKLNKNQEATRGGISSNSGIFALNYTNTGKHLMGRTVSRAKHLPPLLRAFKNRRVDCCEGPSEVVNTQINTCVGSSAGIKKIPIKQLSARNYLKQRAYQCGDGSCRGTAADSLWKLSPEAHASSLTERLAAMALNSEKGCIFNYKVTVVNDGGNKFVLDGNSGMNVQFKVGNTYIFDVSDSTNASHPMIFGTTLVTGSNPSVANYDLIEVIGTQGEKNSKVIFKPKKKGTTWMYCTVHGIAMGSYYNGTSNVGITVLDSDENLIKNRKCYDVERSQNSLLRGRVGCGVMAMTKEIKNSRVAMDASDRIRQIKSRTLNASCITEIKPFNNKKCTPPA